MNTRLFIDVFKANDLETENFQVKYIKMRIEYPNLIGPI